ncbi:MAG TPA: alkyl sulfatase dimerization domain-containing protein [Anaeromyxobacter sp.]
MTRPREAARLLCFILLLASCRRRDATPPGAGGEVTAATREAQQRIASELDLADPRDFEDARRGLVARAEGRIVGTGGEVLVDFAAFDFVEGEAPPTVNPSLWRQARLNRLAGLFQVTEGIYQVRGFDIANMTLVRGRTGWIVVDPLTCRESAAAALAFARRHLGAEPVTAIVFTHSHVDHFGGALAIASAEEVARRRIPVVAPAGFMEEATSENTLVGVAMARRSIYQFGRDLERSPRGLVDTGLGKNVAYGTIGILEPNVVVSQPTEELTLDGVRFVFHDVPGAEAPAELTFSVPERRAYDGAEIVSHTLHNLLPVRGAKVRDALRWSEYLDQAREHAADAEVLLGQHTWPVWGRARIAEIITAQQDAYRYIHDQSVRLMNAGLTATEIAEAVRLPRSLASQFAVRGYYGDVRHDAKAVVQLYLGAYDGNPAHLDPLPPRESARRWVELAGGADRAVEAARAAFERGDHRWCAELLNHVVFAQPDHAEAKALLARTYDQLGYASESATWRNSYLTAAAELRNGPPRKGVDRAAAIEMLRNTPIERFLDALAAALNGPSAEGSSLKINLVLTDTKDSHVLWIRNAVLHHRKAAPADDASATLSMTKELFIRMLAGTAGAADVLMSPDLKVSGSRLDLVRFFRLFDKADGKFPIVTR